MVEFFEAKIPPALHRWALLGNCTFDQEFVNQCQSLDQIGFDRRLAWQWHFFYYGYGKLPTYVRRSYARYLCSGNLVLAKDSFGGLANSDTICVTSDDFALK